MHWDEDLGDFMVTGRMTVQAPTAEAAKMCLTERGATITLIEEQSQPVA